MNKTYKIPARDISLNDSYDVIIAGGGPAGCAAAIAASREGASVLLIEQSGALGGICGEKQMTKCVESISEAGFMMLRILITVTALFFVAIAAVTNATSGI